MSQLQSPTPSQPRRHNQQGFGLIGTLINVVFGIIITLVALRLVFMLFDANAANNFVSWIYNASQPFVAPFKNIFQDVSVLNGRLEMQTLVALVIYTLVGGILSRVFAGSYHSHPA